MLAVHDEPLAEHGGLPGVRAPDLLASALVVTQWFLELNGHQLAASDPACVATFLTLAAGELTEGELATWIRDNSRGPSRVER